MKITTTVKALTIALTIAGSISAYANRNSENAKAAFDGAIKAEKDAMTKSCGCAPKFNISWDQFKTEDDGKIPAQGVHEVAESYTSICKTPADKKAVCSSVKSVVVNKGEPKDPTFDGGVITLTREYNHGYGDLTKAITDKL